MKVNGVEYVKLSLYNKLKKSKTKTKVIKEVKEVEKIVEKEVEKLKLSDYMIMDTANVAAILPITKKNDEIGDEVETAIGVFKKPYDLIITSNLDKDLHSDSVVINGSKYSKEYILQIKKMGKIWFNDKPKILMFYDKVKAEFIKDQPIMFVFGDRMAIVLAPRVEEAE